MQTKVANIKMEAPEITREPTQLAVNLVKVLVENRALSEEDLRRLVTLTPGLRVEWE